MLGAATGVFDFPAVAYFIHLVNDYGMDSIATGATIGWLFEMVERGGLIGEDEIGFPVKGGFGDAEAEERLIKLMAERKGIGGAILADGVKRACERLGRGLRVRRPRQGGWRAPPPGILVAGGRTL